MNSGGDAVYQKDLIRNAWKAAGLYDENDSKLQQFLLLLDDPTQCWTQLIQTCRRDFADYKAKVTQPILDTNDTLVHLMVIRAATSADELALLEQYITTSDPVRHGTELKAIALKRVRRLNKALAKKPGLTEPVREALASPATAAGRAPQKDPSAAPAPAANPPA
jgi:hypothetical protein